MTLLKIKKCNIPIENTKAATNASAVLAKAFY